MRIDGYTTEPRFCPADFAALHSQFIDLDLTTTSTGSSADITIEAGGRPTYVVFHGPTTPPVGIGHALASWLSDALAELGDACAEATEEGYQPVSDLAQANGKSLLSDLASRVTQAPVIHSTPEGGIAIDFRNPERDAAVLLLCEPSGEGACFYDIANKRGRGRCSDAADLLDTIGLNALERMGLL